MKTYAKGVTVTPQLVNAAIELWKTKEAGRKNRWRIYSEFGNADDLANLIASEVDSRSLYFSPLKTKQRVDGCSGKIRDIGIEPIKQQICCYVIELAVKPLIDARTGFWQVSRAGIGQHSLAKAAARWASECTYAVHCDVRKCYDSIKCDTVMKILRKYVKSADVLYVAEQILRAYPGGHLMIGSFFSMRMAHLVLSFGYHFIEEQHVERRGKLVKMVEHQGWYADDVFLFGKSKKNLKTAVKRLQRYMLEEFGLEFKPWKIVRIRDGEPVDVAGYVVRRNRVTVRAKIFRRARRAFFRFRAKNKNLRLAYRVVSYFGWIKNANSKTFVKRHGIRTILRRAKMCVSAEQRKRRCVYVNCQDRGC